MVVREQGSGIQRECQQKSGFVTFLAKRLIDERVIDGKACKRAIWSHKLMHETCSRFILNTYFELLIEAKPTEVIVAKFGASIEVIC